MMKSEEAAGKAMDTKGTRAYVSKEDMMNKENNRGPWERNRKG